MPVFNPRALRSALAKAIPAVARRFCVAYSGGMDSTVLLHAVAALRESERFELRVVHVDHQLHSDSASWREHCKRTAAKLGLELIEEQVRVDPGGAEGLEAAARKARYAVLRARLTADEVLLTAHHADDQLETVMLALLRGSGPRGLGAMRPLQAFEPGWLARPLLGFTREDLETWARAEQLQWTEDPSNESTSFDRNYLRHAVLPTLRARWPSVSVNAVRTASHLADASDLLDELAELDLQQVADGRCVDVCRLRNLPARRRRNLLRRWLRSFELRSPSTRKLIAIDRDVIAADWDRSLRVPLEHRELRRHRQFLYCVPAVPSPGIDSLAWQISQPLELPTGMGSLVMEPAIGRGIATAKLPARLTVRFREGGERMQIAGAQHRRPLKKLLQDQGVLPWWRGRLPLLYAGSQLVAVGDLWVSEDFAAAANEPGLQILWPGRPAIIAQQPVGHAD